MSKALDKIEAFFQSLNKSAVYVGVLGEVRTDKETGATINMAELAAVHEFGSNDGNIPERSFLRSSILENKEKYKQQVAALVKQGIDDGTSAAQVFDMIGAVAAGDAQEKIESGTLPTLKPATIKRKGSSKPLYDTGQLYQAITWAQRDD